MIEGDDCILNLVSTSILCTMFIEGNLGSKENQMKITKLNESKASGKEMGGDLNRIKPPKIEDYSKKNGHLVYA